MINGVCSFEHGSRMGPHTTCKVTGFGWSLIFAEIFTARITNPGRELNKHLLLAWDSQTTPRLVESELLLCHLEQALESRVFQVRYRNNKPFPVVAHVDHEVALGDVQVPIRRHAVAAGEGVMEDALLGLDHSHQLNSHCDGWLVGWLVVGGFGVVCIYRG